MPRSLLKSLKKKGCKRWDSCSMAKLQSEMQETGRKLNRMLASSKWKLREKRLRKRRALLFKSMQKKKVVAVAKNKPKQGGEVELELSSWYVRARVEEPPSSPSRPTVPVLLMKRKTASQQNQFPILEPPAQLRQVSSSQPGQSQKVATIPETPTSSGQHIRHPLNGFLIGCVFWSAQVIDAHNWRRCILFYGGEVVNEYDPIRVTHVLCRNQKFPEFQHILRDGKRLVTVYWLRDTCSRKVLAAPFYAVHLPPPFNESCLPLKGQRFSHTGFEGVDRKRVEIMLKLLGAKYTPYFDKLNHGLVAGRSEGEKFTMAREWKTPVVNVQFLKELLLGHTSCLRMHAPKYQHYSTEQAFLFDINLAPDQMAAWTTPIRIDKEMIEKFEAGKRTLKVARDNAEKAKRQKILEEEVLQISYLEDLSSQPMDDDRNNEDEVENMPPPVIMFSGFTKKFTALATEMLVKLGARFTEDVKEATHLVTWEIGTLRLYSAICRVKYIVGAAWVRDSFKAQRFVDEEGYAASVTSFEKYHKVQISDILKKPDRHVLFEGMTFYLTPGVNVAVRKGLEEMIEAAGGHVDKSSQKSTTEVKAKAKKNPRKYLIITTIEDFEYFSELFGTQPPICIFTVLFIYTCIAEQKVDLENTRGIKSSPKVEPANSE